MASPDVWQFHFHIEIRRCRQNTSTLARYERSAKVREIRGNIPAVSLDTLRRSEASGTREGSQDPAALTLSGHILSTLSVRLGPGKDPLLERAAGSSFFLVPGWNWESEHDNARFSSQALKLPFLN